jgi:predicted phage terminase large subunit-like protein
MTALEKRIAAAMRAKFAIESRTDYLKFVKFTMPDIEDPDDLSLSLFKDSKHHRALAKVLEKVEQGTIPRLIVTLPPRHGKACAHDTPILTTKGWKVHGDLQIGDFVYSPDGTPTMVVYLSPDVQEVVPVTLSNGEVIRCHLNHEWKVFDRRSMSWKVLETRDMLGDTWIGQWGQRGGRARFQLPDVASINFAQKQLPLDPYVLGAWLGDGTSANTRMAHHIDDVEVIGAIVAAGHKITKRWQQASTGVCYAEFTGKRGVGSEFQQALRGLGVLGSKHIPEQYLRASTEQRLELLAGLIDTDGHVEVATGRCRFITGSTALRDGALDLCTTLGFRPYVTQQSPIISSSGVIGRKIIYTVGFQTNLPLPTKIARKAVNFYGLRRRVSIVSIGDVESAPARSIQVARDDGLYLVGRALNVTHNTELISRRFIPWLLGKDAYRNVIFATYNEPFSEDIGSDCRNIMQSPSFKQVFPQFRFRAGGMSKSKLQTQPGGMAAFVGRGGSITGRGADVLIIDDPIKNSEEAQSPALRQKLWDWFTQDAMTRMMTKFACVVIVHTRWHEDDLIGRITDPTNPCYSDEEAQKWKIINLPAIALENDPLGRKPGEALWPERFDLDFLYAARRLDSKGFSALYQQQPSPEDGDLFRAEWITTYDKSQLPDDLRVYAASDHAIGEDKSRNDATVMIVGGVDKYGDLYLLDVWWEKQGADKQVEAMLRLAKKWKPILWFAERGHISKAIAPFLRKRMQEEQNYFSIEEVTPIANKVQRAQSIMGRMSMKKVKFPKHAVWYMPAREELLKFPNARHDDFVDALAWLGRAVDRMASPQAAVKKDDEIKYGTLGWLKQDSAYRDRQQRLVTAIKGW